MGEKPSGLEEEEERKTRAAAFRPPEEPWDETLDLNHVWNDPEERQRAQALRAAALDIYGVSEPQNLRVRHYCQGPFKGLNISPCPDCGGTA